LAFGGGSRRLAILAAEILMFSVSGVGAFLLRFDLSIPHGQVTNLLYALPVWIVAKAFLFRLHGLDRGWWRYVAMADVARIGVVNLLGSAASSVIIYSIAPPGFPRSVYLLDLLICSVITAGARMAVRMIAEAGSKRRETGEERRVLIYGAGEAGAMLLREIRSSRNHGYSAVGFVDDDPRKRGVRIQGTAVMGAGPELPMLATKHRIDEILIAIPSAGGSVMTRILELCQSTGVKFRTVPCLADMIQGNGLAAQIRDVAVEDLLGRNPVRLDQDQIRSRIEGELVLVTGAAGSIGSELCRQIARFRPSGIVGFEMAESALFTLEREMRRSFPGVPFHAEIGSVQNQQRLRDVFRQYRPQVVYHAAAYKHVPMMETHVFEALENNVFGTYNAAVEAAESGASAFVLISTDKAVRPTSVMGATKRLAELAVQSLQNGHTRFVGVRFGNVLGSNGSVIPIFKEQIAAGGPVTVTHPEMQRYFLTIPEAAQLVLQAGSIGAGGEILVLDMGQPVKILDLARNLILLSGLRPGIDIPVVMTGVRPGEKLYEELRAFEESTVPTSHEKIKSFLSPVMAADEMERHLHTLKEICERRDCPALILKLKECVPEYNPSSSLLRKALGASQEAVSEPARRQSVITLRAAR
jgi:FlaA1/EpsC-like NDP-sugar epimerase